MTDATTDETYGGFIGAIPYAFRATESRLCRWYVLIGTLVAALIAVLFTLGVVTLVGGEMGEPGGLLTSARAFYVVVALFLVGPLLAPILLVARRHRRDRGDARYDRAMAASGFVFLGSLYVGLAVSMPPEFETSGEGPFAPLVDVVHSLPDASWPLFPVAATAIMLLVHRRYR